MFVPQRQPSLLLLPSSIKKQWLPAVWGPAAEWCIWTHQTTRHELRLFILWTHASGKQLFTCIWCTHAGHVLYVCVFVYIALILYQIYYASLQLVLWPTLQMTEPWACLHLPAICECLWFAVLTAWVIPHDGRFFLIFKVTDASTTNKTDSFFFADALVKKILLQRVCVCAYYVWETTVCICMLSMKALWTHTKTKRIPLTPCTAPTEAVQTKKTNEWKWQIAYQTTCVMDWCAQKKPSSYKDTTMTRQKLLFDQVQLCFGALNMNASWTFPYGKQRGKKVCVFTLCGFYGYPSRSHYITDYFWKRWLGGNYHLCK